MKYIIVVAMLSACSMSPELKSHLDAEKDFHANQQYQEDIYNHRAYRPEVYAEPDFLSDCIEYDMIECYE